MVPRAATLPQRRAASYGGGEPSLPLPFRIARVFGQPIEAIFADGAEEQAKAAE